MDSLRLLGALAAGGIQHIAFTGGDPSLRADIDILVRHARQLGLFAEILTNGQHQSQALLGAVAAADLLGLSLDGPTAGSHDLFRSKRGNFDAVLALMHRSEDAGRPFVVRTLVSKRNERVVGDLAELLVPFRHLSLWTLQQFSPVGLGFANSDLHEISDVDFAKVVGRITARWPRDHHASVRALSNAGRRGTYMIVDPSGVVLGGPEVRGADGLLPRGKSLLEAHLADVVPELTVVPESHSKRYSDWFGDGPI